MNIIRKYINLLIESSNTGWDELNNIIMLLKSVNKFNEQNKRKDEEELISEYINIVENEGYESIGFGHNRIVFSKPTLPWVIKITIDSDFDWDYANKIEYNKYFDDFRDNSILTKVYSFDTNTSLWIIQEKVKKIESIETLKLLFPLFSKNLEILSIKTGLNTQFNDVYDYWDLISNLILTINHYKLFYENNRYKEESILNIFLQYLSKINQNYSESQILTSLKKFNLLNVTNDILYVSNHLYTIEVADLSLSNIGYSETILNNNLNTGFKAIKIFDYAE
jgi:hypothetical protein